MPRQILLLSGPVSQPALRERIEVDVAERGSVVFPHFTQHLLHSLKTSLVSDVLCAYRPRGLPAKGLRFEGGNREAKYSSKPSTEVEQALEPTMALTDHGQRLLVGLFSHMLLVAQYVGLAPGWSVNEVPHSQGRSSLFQSSEGRTTTN